MTYWINSTELGSGVGLGNVHFYHVHDDESKHEAKFNVKDPSGMWTSTPGEFTDAITVQCDDCGAVMVEGDDIRSRMLTAPFTGTPPDFVERR